MSMPAPLAEVVSDFADVEGQDKLALLLEFLDDTGLEDLTELSATLQSRADAAMRVDDGQADEPGVVVRLAWATTAGSS